MLKKFDLYSFDPINLHFISNLHDSKQGSFILSNQISFLLSDHLNEFINILKCEFRVVSAHMSKHQRNLVSCKF